MYSMKKIKDCGRFKAIDQSTEMRGRADIESNCRNCKFFNSRNCGLDAADEIDPLPGMWS